MCLTGLCHKSCQCSFSVSLLGCRLLSDGLILCHWLFMSLLKNENKDSMNTFNLQPATEYSLISRVIYLFKNLLAYKERKKKGNQNSPSFHPIFCQFSNSWPILVIFILLFSSKEQVSKLLSNC